eukprot:TRINITY_DN3402_c1_g1_i1.p10 TRINITY_DN3402_c1_g1~~TRINITY_DN3402_c1_g1_i1.p10  ORF type:complete len:106 (-),score=2.89 TRINITY_DN3402_c1_g1_i1:359-676(-)
MNFIDSDQCNASSASDTIGEFMWVRCVHQGGNFGGKFVVDLFKFNSPEFGLQTFIYFEERLNQGGLVVLSLEGGKGFEDHRQVLLGKDGNISAYNKICQMKGIPP